MGAQKEEINENIIKRNSNVSKLSNFDFFEKKQKKGKFASLEDDKSYKKSGLGEINENGSDFEEKINEEDGNEKKGEENKKVINI